MITTLSPTFTTTVTWMNEGLAKTLKTLIKEDAYVWMDDGLPEGYQTIIQQIVSTARCYRVPRGEASKEFAQLHAYLDWLHRQPLTQTSVMVIIGGGAVLDAISFVASIYRRGLPLVLIPTTLLAMVDASIGGKTALNFGSKNQIGTFYPAKSIYLDASLAQDLPLTLWQEGMVEIIKIALVSDANFVQLLQTKSLTLEAMIRRAIELKLSLVSQDLQDQHVRRLLNFGHTFGHALEAASQFTISHGRCVAEGMLLELEGSDFYQPVKNLLQLYETLSPIQYDRRDLLSHLQTDKKRAGNKIQMIQLNQLGEAVLIDEGFDAVSKRLLERK
jgi:3-dehydroquinate synthase